MKGILLVLGSLCLAQNANAETIGGFPVEHSEDLGGGDKIFTISLAKGPYAGILDSNNKRLTVCKTLNKYGYVECFINGFKGHELDIKQVHSYRRIFQINCGDKRVKDLIITAHSGDFGLGKEISLAVDDTWESYTTSVITSLACSLVKNSM